MLSLLLIFWSCLCFKFILNQILRLRYDLFISASQRRVYCWALYICFPLPDVTCILFNFEHSILNWDSVPVSVVGVSVLTRWPSALFLDVHKLFPHVNIVRVTLYWMDSSTCLFLLYNQCIFFVVLISREWASSSFWIGTVVTLTLVVDSYFFFYSIKVSSWIKRLIVSTAVVDTCWANCWYLSSVWFCWAFWASSETSPFAIFWENYVDR